MQKRVSGDRPAGTREEDRPLWGRSANTDGRGQFGWPCHRPTIPPFIPSPAAAGKESPTFPPYVPACGQCWPRAAACWEAEGEWRRAAVAHTTGGRLRDAARCWEAAGEPGEAAAAWQRVRDWRRAAVCWQDAGRYAEAVQSLLPRLLLLLFCHL